jgi:hypothetical protein
MGQIAFAKKLYDNKSKIMAVEVHNPFKKEELICSECGLKCTNNQCKNIECKDPNSTCNKPDPTVKHLQQFGSKRKKKSINSRRARKTKKSRKDPKNKKSRKKSPKKLSFIF